METFSTLLAICERPVTQSFDVFFDLCLNKRLSKQSWGWWFETLSHPFWRQRNAILWAEWQPFCSHLNVLKVNTPWVVYWDLHTFLGLYIYPCIPLSYDLHIWHLSLCNTNKNCDTILLLYAKIHCYLDLVLYKEWRVETLFLTHWRCLFCCDLFSPQTLIHALWQVKSWQGCVKTASGKL